MKPAAGRRQDSSDRDGRSLPGWSSAAELLTAFDQLHKMMLDAVRADPV